MLKVEFLLFIQSCIEIIPKRPVFFSSIFFPKVTQKSGTNFIAKCLQLKCKTVGFSQNVVSNLLKSHCLQPCPFKCSKKQQLLNEALHVISTLVMNPVTLEYWYVGLE